MLKRTLTGAVILIVTLGFVMLKQFHSIIFDVFVLLLTYGALYETSKAYKLAGKKVDYSLYLVPAAICTIFNLEKNIFICFGYIVLLAVVLVGYLLLSEVISYGIKRKKGIAEKDTEAQNKILFDKTKYSMQTFIYPILLISMFFALNHLSYEIGYMGIILAFAISMLTDTVALLFGMAFGKHKFCPEVSPKKTIEGMIGGLVGGLVGAVCCFVFFYFTPYFCDPIKANLTLYIAIFAVVGVVGSLLTQLGDLVESALKRKVGVKDMGSLFPGHGGFMDRVDGLMFTASLIAIVFALFLV